MPFQGICDDAGYLPSWIGPPPPPAHAPPPILVPATTAATPAQVTAPAPPAAGAAGAPLLLKANLQLWLSSSYCIPTNGPEGEGSAVGGAV